MLKKIFKTIYYLILAVIAVVALFLIFSVVPIKGGYKTLVVLSGSMEPKIHTGSVVAIKPEKEYQVGIYQGYLAFRRLRPPEVCKRSECYCQRYKNKEYLVRAYYAGSTEARWRAEQGFDHSIHSSWKISR